MNFNDGLEAAARWHDCQAAALKPGRSHSLRKIRRFHEIAAQEIRSRVVSPVPNEPVMVSNATKLETVALLGGIRGVDLLSAITNMRTEHVLATYRDGLVKRSQAEAIVATKDAQIKELSEALDKQRKLDNESTLHHYNRAEDIKAKLAAAQEVAQLVIQAEEDKSGDPNFYTLLMQTAYEKARIALGVEQ